MRCSFHPEREAVAACVECGRGICEECKIELRKRARCPECAQRRSGLITAAGVLNIIGGVFWLITGLIFVALGALFGRAPGAEEPGKAISLVMSVFGGPGLILGGLGIAGGVVALKRRLWGLALAGAILTWNTLSLVFLALRRRDFR